jgi:LacI family transcriptional regulator, galactose operon repressor
MRDVAVRARTSFKTVSRVVNDEGGVSPQLVRRVREAIDELGFRPNVGARSLRRTDPRTATIGLLLEDVANPFSAAVARAVEDVAVPRGVIVYSASLDEDPARERALVRQFAARGVDGLLIAPAGDDHGHLAAELRAGTAVVCVDRVATGLAVDAVVSTNATGSTEGVRHLLAHGHRRIAFLGDHPAIATTRQRLAGYTAALADAGLDVDPALVVVGLRNPGDADGAATTLLGRPDPPTALFTAQNLLTAGAVRALRRVRQHHAVAVVGFDDILLADLLDPGITVVAQDPVAIGRLAADRLFDRIAGTTADPEVRYVPTTLIRRGSGEITPPR